MINAKLVVCCILIGLGDYLNLASMNLVGPGITCKSQVTDERYHCLRIKNCDAILVVDIARC